MKYWIALIAILVFSMNVMSQTYQTRTGHIHVQSSNKIKNIEGDNYQVRGSMDAATGAVNFTGLLKSFEFKLGALDRVFSSDRLNVNQHPGFKYEGKILKHQSIPLTTPGTYNVNIKGILYIWDEKRTTSAKGTISVLPNGKIKAKSDFTIVIEEKNVAKMNKLIQSKLPGIVSMDLNTFGVSRNINIKLSATFKKRR